MRTELVLLENLPMADASRANGPAHQEAAKLEKASAKPGHLEMPFPFMTTKQAGSSSLDFLERWKSTGFMAQARYIESSAVALSMPSRISKPVPIWARGYRCPRNLRPISRPSAVGRFGSGRLDCQPQLACLLPARLQHLWFVCNQANPSKLLH